MKILFNFVSVLSLSILTVTSVAFAQTSSEQPRRARVGEIEVGEKEKYRTRFEAKNSKTFSFGPAFSANLNSSKMMYAGSLGYEWEAAGQGAVFVEALGSHGDGATYLHGVLGGKYFFSDEDLSPFARIGFGMGFADGRDIKSVTGFAGTVGLGVTMFRTSTVHLEVMASYSTLLTTNEHGTPGLSALTLGILF